MLSILKLWVGPLQCQSIVICLYVYVAIWLYGYMVIWLREGLYSFQLQVMLDQVDCIFFLVLQKLMKDHLDNMAKFEDNLKREQGRTKDALKAKLEERRRKRTQSEMEKGSIASAGEVSEPKEKQRIAPLHREVPRIVDTNARSAPRAYAPHTDAGMYMKLHISRMIRAGGCYKNGAAAK